MLGKEKITLSSLRIEQARRLLFFKHEERPLLVTPHKLVIGRSGPDELNRGFSKVNVAFTLPPGSYATLVIKRLFHFSWSRSHETEHADQVAGRVAPAPKPPPPPRERPRGFLERQREKKQRRSRNQRAGKS